MGRWQISGPNELKINFFRKFPVEWIKNEIFGSEKAFEWIIRIIPKEKVNSNENWIHFFEGELVIQFTQYVISDQW